MRSKTTGSRRANQNENSGVPAAKLQDGTLPQYQPRHTTRNARRLLAASLFNMLCTDFQAHGAAAIRACREEQPQGYLRLIAAVVPDELDTDNNPLKDIPDDEIDSLIEFFRGRLFRRQDCGALDGGEGPASG